MNKITQSIILGIMCLILTIGICIQVKTVNSNGSTINASKSVNDLKDQVLKMKEKYDNSYQKLEKAQEELENIRQSVTSNNEKLKSQEEEIKKDSILLGFSDVTGPGVTITVTDANAKLNSITSLIDPLQLIVHDTDILEIVNELKNAGAEAIEVNGQRIVNTSAIVCDGNVITINGEKISSTFTINAIGLSERMVTLTRAGGYLERLEQYYIKTTFKKVDKITIPKYTGITKFKYATTVE